MPERPSVAVAGTLYCVAQQTGSESEWRSRTVLALAHPDKSTAPARAPRLPRRRRCGPASPPRRPGRAAALPPSETAATRRHGRPCRHARRSTARQCRHGPFCASIFSVDAALEEQQRARRQHRQMRHAFEQKLAPIHSGLTSARPMRAATTASSSGATIDNWRSLRISVPRGYHGSRPPERRVMAGMEIASMPSKPSASASTLRVSK